MIADVEIYSPVDEYCLSASHLIAFVGCNEVKMPPMAYYYPYMLYKKTEAECFGKCGEHAIGAAHFAV